MCVCVLSGGIKKKDISFPYKLLLLFGTITSYRAGLQRQKGYYFNTAEGFTIMEPSVSIWVDDILNLCNAKITGVPFNQ